MRYLEPHTAELLAAEYVLGTLQGAARRRFENLLRAHPGLRRRVLAWQQQLSGLAGEAAPVSPPASVWAGIQRRLFPDEIRPPWHRRLNVWRGLSLSGAALAAALAALLVLTPIHQEMPDYVVMISDTAQEPLWLISTSADMESFYVKNLKPMDMPKDVRCLLWLKPKNSDRAYPLGILPDKGDGKMIEVEENMRPMLPGPLLVTIEHIAGDLPLQPGGAAVYQGNWMPLAKI